MTDTPSYFRYWGKAKPSTEEGPQYHLLPYHSLDVAAVGFHLLCPEDHLCQRLAKQLNVPPEWLQAWFSFCLILHDLGKFCRAFQNLSPDLSTKLVSFSPSYVYDKRHDTLGFALWRHLAKKFNSIPLEYLQLTDKWLEIVCGHHGTPPENLRAVKQYLAEEDEHAAHEFISDVIKTWLPNMEPLEDIDKKKFKQVSWQLAGIAVLADWLGSNQYVFEYCVDEMPLNQYWNDIALHRATQSIAQAKINHRNITPFVSIKQQFDFIQTPTPLQKYASSVELSESPQLFILEDVTGAGKTEAAMVLVHRLMATGQATGVYVGLPTMATANAMYQRMAKSYRRLYSEDELPSLVLAHGARNLSDDFIKSVMLTEQLPDQSYEKDEYSASAYCNQWLADSRKKALLADVGVGTIDQALLGVLPARHQSLRLLGLTDKILLVDEVHAYDPYMRRLLSALLEAHAAQGGSAILLSATLPSNFREELTLAYAQGATFPKPELNHQADYPWAMQLNNKGLHEAPVDTRASVRRSVTVDRLNTEIQAYDVIKQTISKGNCICWVRNTVKDARDVYQWLSEQPWVDTDKVTLFHSRYAMADRQVIETDVISRFGKASGTAQRSAQILIATQVVEQSLDLDFDVMISDLAPIDLLIQRAGRLQRHIRAFAGNCLSQIEETEQRNPPHLYILTPDPDKVDKNWLRNALPGTQAVYPNVGQLWLTAKILLTKKGFTMPDDARSLVEGVYGNEAQTMIPEMLEQASNDAEAEQRAMHGMGEFNRLRLEKGYTLASAQHSGGWNEEVHIPTRLGSDTVTVALAKQEANHLKPYAGDTKHGWALSQLSLPRKEWEKAKKLIPRVLEQDIEQLKEQEPALRWIEVLPLVKETSQLYQNKTGWIGENNSK